MQVAHAGSRVVAVQQPPHNLPRILSLQRPVRLRPGTAGRTPTSGQEQKRNSCCYATAAGGGSGGGWTGVGGGRPGGSGGDGGSGDSSEPSKGGLWQGWEARVAADPQFVYKVIVEQVIGVGAAVAGDMSSRPYWGLYELDFVFSTLVVGSLVNFALMYLLAPTGAASGAAATGFFAKLFSESTLKAWGAPGGHMFEAGFPLKARLLNLAYKGGLFALVGMGAGVIGTAVSNGLIAVRKAVDPNFETQNELPNIPLNSFCWASHMGISSNIRYQLINGFEMALQPKLPGVPFRILTSVVRTINNLVGGVSFVMVAKMLGAQASAGDEVKLQEKGCCEHDE